MDKFKTLKDHVYDYIAEKILLGELSPNEKINENIICNELSVSRTPVREALIELSCGGILENVPRKGFVVKTLTLKEISELYTVIGLLEGQAAELSCPKLTNRDIKDMQFYIDSMEIAIEGENYEMYHKQQVTFHQKLVEKCDNDILISTIAQLKNKILKKSYDDEIHIEIKKILLDTNQEHQHILDLLSQGKGHETNEYLRDVHWRTHQAGLDIL